MNALSLSIQEMVKVFVTNRKLLFIATIFAVAGTMAACNPRANIRVRLTPTPTPTATPVPPEGAQVSFVSPVDGDTVTSPFTVEMVAEELTVEPAGENIEAFQGHMHILVNTDFVAPGETITNDEQHLHFGDGSLETELELEPGDYTLRLQFADGAHTALEGDIYRDEINITVEDEASE
ncbi:MAG: DUF4399 domain-containing protein [Anaerolineae bacterium]|nr:DUF4399 domain-containing protein [Anaerolineae bacterium]